MEPTSSSDLKFDAVVYSILRKEHCSRSKKIVGA